MRSLQSIINAQSEARYISRSWGNSPSSAPDKPYSLDHYTPPVKSPDDIIGVCVPDSRTLSGAGIAYIKRSEYEANKAKYQADMAQWQKEYDAKRKASK
jgi:hypothetical protein